MIKELKSIHEKLEELYAVELLQYHNQNWLSGGPKKISEEIQASLRHIMHLVEKIDPKDFFSQPKMFIFQSHHNRPDPLILLQVSETHVVALSKNEGDEQTVIGKAISMEDLMMQNFRPYKGTLEFLGKSE